MNSILERALAETSGGIKGLRAVVLSAAPDGLIAWSWAADGKPDIALGFAALDRAATACLTSLGASDQSRSLLLTAKDCWVAAWPLFEFDEGQAPAQRLVVTTVFGGDLQSGMVMVYGTRVRAQLRAALDQARTEQTRAVRRALVHHLSQAGDPAAALSRVADEVEIDLRRLGCIEQLGSDDLQRLAARLNRPDLARPRLLQ